MSFRVAKKDEGIKWPVFINEPVAGGAVRQHKVHAYFIVKDKQVIDELVDEGDFEFMRAVIDPAKGWEGFSQESEVDGQPDQNVEYSEKKLEEFLGVPYIAAGFIDAYFKFVAGVSSKNSKRRQHGG